MTHVKRHLEGLLALLLRGTGDVPGLRDMRHVTAYGIGEDLTRQSLLVGFNIDGISSTDLCDRYRGEQLRLHATGHDPFFGLMLKQLGISSFIRLSGSHYNSPREIERFLEATAKFAPARVQVPVGASAHTR
jgi:selenocysteine lyase/cysteine desulfurase